MKNYFLQIYEATEEPASKRDMVMIDELPYRKLTLERLSAMGVIDIVDGKLPADQIDRVAKILRLCQALGVNLSGAAIICDLLDRLDEMEERIERHGRF